MRPEQPWGDVVRVLNRRQTVHWTAERLRRTVRRLVSECKSVKGAPAARGAEVNDLQGRKTGVGGRLIGYARVSRASLRTACWTVPGHRGAAIA